MSAALSLENNLVSNNAAVSALSNAFGFLSPQGASVAKFESDCCGCNNYPQQEG